MKHEYIWVGLRLVMGCIFLWAFLDKVFGLGFATEAGKSWLRGISPTKGFLTFGTHGVLASFFQGLAGSVFVDWLFMMGLMLVGLSLLAGVGMKIAGYSGALMMILIYLSSFPPKNNPVFDEHIVYSLVLIGLATSHAGHVWGFGQWWSKQRLVKHWPLLQ